MEKTCKSIDDATAKKLRELKLTNDNILEICDTVGINVVSIVDNTVNLRTGSGEWILTLQRVDDTVATVRHRHIYRYQNSGYHRQKVSATKLYDVVSYIQKHDRKVLSGNNSRMNSLFNKIEQQNLKKKGNK